MINTQMTQFFKLLSSSPKAVFTCAWMRPEGGVVSGSGCFFVEAADIEGLCKEYEDNAGLGALGELEPEKLKQGKLGTLPELHTTLNQTNLTGRKTENIIGVRVLCVDLDRKIDDAALEDIKKAYLPQWIVQSSPGKYHLYWRVSPSLPLQRWNQFQLGLAWKLGGDKSLSQLAHMIRVPGLMRRCKDGQSWVPTIVWDSSESLGGSLPEFTEKGVLHHFKGISEWCAAGEEELKVERAAISKIARDSYRNMARHADFMKAVPSVGRNTALYMAVKEAVYQQGFDYAAAQSYGVGLNEGFGNPLESREVSIVVDKAWRKAIAALERKAEKETEMVNILVSDDGVVPSNGRSSNNGCSSAATTDVAATTVADVIKAIIEPTPPRTIPDSLFEAGELWGNRLWAGGNAEGVKAIQLFCVCRRKKQWTRFASLLCDRWKDIGAFRKSGPVVFLQGHSRWGSDVHYAHEIDRELFQSVVSHAIARLTNLGMKYGQGSLKKRLKDAATQPQMTAIERVIWPLALSHPVQNRQSPDIIVYQNGVFDLGSGRFIEDVMAPLKYSHPVACRFDNQAAEEVFRGTAVEAVVPRFARYMQDWFPGDTGIVKVMLRFFGYCMTVDYSRQMFAFFYGPTRAGKGSICRTVCALLGDTNYYSADYEVLNKNFKSAEMHDKLLISIEEAAEGEGREVDKRMNYLKKLLGGEKITFERKYSRPFDDNLVGKFVMQSNEPPQYQDKQHAIRARMLCVGFERSFEHADVFVDPVADILGSEADKLGTLMALAWARGRQESTPFKVEGSQALAAGQRDIADAIDVVGAFVRKYCSYSKDWSDNVPASDLRLALEIMIEVQDTSTPGRLPMRLKQELSTLLPRSRMTVAKGTERKSYRAFQGIEFNLKKFKQDYENECGIGSITALKYQELLNARGDLKESTIEKEEV